MNEMDVDALERQKGVISVQSDACGLYYFFCPGDKRIAVAGMSGITILSKNQAIALAAEIEDVVRLHLAGIA